MLEYSVGRMTREDLVIDWEFSSGERTVPDFVVTLPLSIAGATIVSKNTLNLISVIGHQAARTVIRSSCL